MPPLDGLKFEAPPSEHEFAALLFDMDGTIIDSTDAIVQFWRELGEEIGVDGDLILQTSHGRRTIDTLAIHAPHLADWEHILPLEASIPERHASSAVEIPGARTLLDALSSLPSPHPLWAIVTSGTRGLVRGWFDAMRLAEPPALVCAEEVGRGKPDPGCYLLGAGRLGLLQGRDAAGGEGSGLGGHEVLVLEDAPAGIRAGRAAGFRVLAVATTHEVPELRDAGADWVVRDLRSVGVRWDAGRGRVRVEIRDAWVV